MKITTTANLDGSEHITTSYGNVEGVMRGRCIGDNTYTIDLYTDGNGVVRISGIKEEHGPSLADKLELALLAEEEEERGKDS